MFNQLCSMSLGPVVGLMQDEGVNTNTTYIELHPCRNRCCCPDSFIIIIIVDKRLS